MSLAKYKLTKRPLSSGSAGRRQCIRRAAIENSVECQRQAKERSVQLQDQVDVDKMLAFTEINLEEPWGRPGCGAPIPTSIRRRDIRKENLYPEDELKKSCRLPVVSIKRTPRKYKLSLNGGNNVNGDQEYVNNTLLHTYRIPRDEQQAYRKKLDELVEVKNKMKNEEKRREKEIDNHIRQAREPWGKQGPGGLPWRDPRRTGHNFLHSLGWTNNNTFNESKHKKRNANINSRSLNNKSIHSSYKVLPPIERSEQDESKQEEQVPNDKSNINESNKATVFDADGMELVPLLGKRRHLGPRPLPSSDVTKLTPDHIQWRQTYDVDYLNELIDQMHVKSRQYAELKKISAEEYKRHCETWNTLWGRPGHGAPTPQGFHRHDLTRLLYLPPLSTVH